MTGYDMLIAAASAAEEATRIVAEALDVGNCYTAKREVRQAHYRGSHAVLAGLTVGEMAVVNATLHNPVMGITLQLKPYPGKFGTIAVLPEIRFG